MIISKLCVGLKIEDLQNMIIYGLILILILFLLSVCYLLLVIDRLSIEMEK